MQGADRSSTSKKYRGVANTVVSNRSTGLVIPKNTPPAIVTTKAIAQITTQNGSSGIRDLGAAGFDGVRLSAGLRVLIRFM